MALSVPPSQFWSGIDGLWSPFVIQVGSLPTAVSVLVSTSETIDYVVVPEGCPPLNSTCVSDRGNLYDPSQSSTWHSIGWYNVEAEMNLGYSEKGEYGYDTVTLGYQGSGLPSLVNQTIAGIAGSHFYLGLLGILPKPFNFTTYDNPIPSFIESLKKQSKIPSLSWGYTAGAHFELNGVFGSLTLGGFNAGKFVANDVSFPMNAESIQYLTVGVTGIVISAGGQKVQASSTPFNVSLDSTLPYLWLPDTVCQKFVDTFNLSYDETTQLYFLSETVLAALAAQSPSPSVTFTLNSPLSGNVDITLPFAAFNLTARPPLVTNTTQYFPLKKAANSSQYVLGRTFFQSAYIIADFERHNFSVSQCLFEANAPENLTPLYPPENITITTPQPPPSTSGSSTNGGVIAGVVVGILAALIIAVLLLWWWRRRRQRRVRNDWPVQEPAEIDGNINAKEMDAVDSGRATPTNGYKRSPPWGSPPRSPPIGSPLSELEVNPLSEMDANVYHELDSALKGHSAI